MTRCLAQIQQVRAFFQTLVTLKVEIREKYPLNCGRDPFPIFFRRGKLGRGQARPFQGLVTVGGRARATCDACQVKVMGPLDRHGFRGPWFPSNRGRSKVLAVVLRSGSSGKMS